MSGLSWMRSKAENECLAKQYPAVTLLLSRDPVHNHTTYLCLPTQVYQYDIERG